MNLDTHIGDFDTTITRLMVFGQMVQESRFGETTARDFVNRIFDSQVTLLAAGSGRVLFDGTLRELARVHFADIRLSTEMLMISDAQLKGGKHE